ncbi:hypothetical protein RUND412_002817 [Rhizina undulata]
MGSRKKGSFQESKGSPPGINVLRVFHSFPGNKVVLIYLPNRLDLSVANEEKSLFSEDLHRCAPTGCEYYRLFPAGSKLSSEVLRYDKRRLPLNPDHLTQIGCEVSLLNELETNKITAIDELLQERNSRTFEDGEWVLTGLNVIASVPEEFGLVIRFYPHEGSQCFMPKTISSCDSDKELHSSDDKHPSYQEITSTSTPQVISPESISSVVPESRTSGSKETAREYVIPLDIDASEYVETKALADRHFSDESWDEAREPLQKMLDMQEDFLASIEKEKLQIKHNIAETYRQSSRSEEAIKMYNSTLEGRKRLLGEYHRDTLETMFSLARCHLERTPNGDAEPLLKRCLEGRQISLGGHHEDTQAVRLLLADFYWQRGDSDRATDLLETCLDCQRAVFGALHDETLKMSYELGKIYETLNLLEEAESTYRIAWDHCRKSNSAWRYSIGSVLGSLYEKQGCHIESSLIDVELRRKK